MNTFVDYQLALALNEEARQKAALYRLVKEQRSKTTFVQRLQNLFSKSQKRRKYGLQ